MCLQLAVFAKLECVWPKTRSRTKTFLKSKLTCCVSSFITLSIPSSHQSAQCSAVRASLVSTNVFSSNCGCVSRVCMQSSYDRDSPNMTDDEQDKEVVFAEEKNNNEKIFNAEIVWGNVVKFAFLHVVGICGLFVLPFTCAETIAFFFITGTFSAMVTYKMYYTLHLHTHASVLIVTVPNVSLSTQGVTAGVHRLWTHRSYKAHWPLRLLLVGANSMAAENSIYTWARDHRAHHKYSETDADPHNSNRGMFFAHVMVVFYVLRTQAK